MTNKIKVAVAGVGSCASALIQGVQWYIDNPEESVGIGHRDVGGYDITDMEFVVAFDVDARKVGKPLREAIYSKPNCNMRVVNSVNDVVPEHATVVRGPTLDGIAPHMRDYPEDVTFVEDTEIEPVGGEEYKNILNFYEVDVLLNYVPVGSDEAAKFYIENAVKAGVHVINCMPSYIATEDARELEQLAIDHGVTLVMSDMRSSWGACLS